MIIVESQRGIPIRLTTERWNHITHRHPEFNECKNMVLETIKSLEMILEGDYGELLAVHYYPQTPLTSKYLVVAYKEISSSDGFILTAYFTNSISERRMILWKQ